MGGYGVTTTTVGVMMTSEGDGLWLGDALWLGDGLSVGGTVVSVVSTGSPFPCRVTWAIG
jgi:hypothetical protein